MPLAIDEAGISGIPLVYPVLIGWLVTDQRKNQASVVKKEYMGDSILSLSRKKTCCIHLNVSNVSCPFLGFIGQSYRLFLSLQ